MTFNPKAFSIGLLMGAVFGLLGVFAGTNLPGCEHGALIYIDTCESDPYAYEFCFEDCFETVEPYCDEFCVDYPTSPWCDPGTGGTGGDGGTGGTAGAGGSAGAGGEGGTGGTIPECRCDWHCLDGNHCTYDECIDGVCVNDPRPEGTICYEDGKGGLCDNEGNCEIGRGCPPGHCKDRKHSHQQGHGHCEDHCEY